MFKKLWVPFILVIFSMVVVCAKLYASEWPADLLEKIDKLHELAKEKKEMPATLEGIKVITEDEAYKLWKEKKAIFLDNRVKSQYDTEKIPGALWFFTDDFIKKGPEMADTLDKNRQYVVYCNGVTCWRSPAMALMLKHLGFKVMWFRKGLPAWKTKGYPTE